MAGNSSQVIAEAAGFPPTGEAPSGAQGLRPLGEELQGQKAALLTGLEGSARAFALARLWLAAPRPWLVVTPTLAAAELLARDLEFFLAGEGGESGPVRSFPAYEVSPYQEMDPPPEITARRLAVLWELLAAERPLLVVTSARGLSARLCPPEHLVDRALALRPGQVLERDALVQALVDGGYGPVSLVEQVGDFAVRGSVVDFYGPLLDDPVRVEFLDDRLESLRRFDPADQRSQLALKEAALIPWQPVDLSVGAVARAVGEARKLAAREGLSSRHLAALVERMELRAPFTGLESLLPLYYPRAADLFAFLPAERWQVILEPAEVRERLAAEAAILEEEFREAREEGRVVLPPPALRRTPAQVTQRLLAAPRLYCKALPLAGQDDQADWEAGLVPRRFAAQSHPGLHDELGRAGEGSILANFLAWAGRLAAQGRRVVLVCRSRSQVDRLRELFAEREVAAKVIGRALEASEAGAGEAPPGLYLLVGGLKSGFAPADAPLVFVTEDEVLGAPRVVRQKAPPSLSALLAALDDLTPGDQVVHADFGIALYEGLTSMAVGAGEGDFLQLAFAGGDKLYLPADRVGLISKYRGPEGVKPPLDRLGGKSWQRTKAKVKKAVETIAQDLVDLYATRSFLKGRALAPPDSGFREFEAGFPYSETPDQARAIEDVLADLTAPRPMDRLVCGDVGYGKTEVAMRAAFLVASQGHQVAFLVPTTVLAEQHFQTFAARLRNTPVRVESLSRFKTAAQQKKTLEELAAGQVDVIVGTHRLLQKDVLFKDLGLVVVDEEHRFGVKDKERLKKLRKMVDVLAMTATPIPRTMQMSLSGIRDLSIINTPPEDRQAIKTYLAPFSPKAIREAVERELARGGQVFFVHNRVSDLTKLARMVQSLVPAARVGVAHGQLNEKALERVMMKFVHRELDVLACTTIIESGLDIPSANTIIINDADKLGLSQIYQLRGRVGRAQEVAYAYLFIKSETSLSKEARQRLKALMDFTQLGAGFSIAMHDLQIRGAGNLLGEAQSGHAAEVGYELYVQMLEEAVARLKGEAPSEGPEPEMRLLFAAGLPEGYVPDPQVRLSLYRRLGRVRQGEELMAVRAELQDRFGPLPDPAENLLQAVELKGLLRRLFAERLDLSAGSLKVRFAQSDRLDLPRLLELARSAPKAVRVYPDGQVSLAFDPKEPPLAAARRFLQSIAGNGN